MDSSEILDDFWKTHPKLNLADWVSQPDAIKFLKCKNRERLHRPTRAGFLKYTLICKYRYYNRQSLIDYLYDTEVVKGKISMYEFEKRKLAMIQYHVKTTEYLPMCWVKSLCSKVYKERTIYYMKSKLDYQMIRTVKVYHSNWANLEDVIYYLLEGKGIELDTAIKPIEGLKIDLNDILKIIERK